MNCISTPSCFNNVGISYYSVSEKEPGTIIKTAVFMNEILMILVKGMKMIERCDVKEFALREISCEVNETADRLSLLHKAMISLSDNDGVRLFVA
ncbi:1184_t:CDS:2 [Funneliformis mosseae]|uniref:1184_t:CDS:1 n=1 Tax=Funneliformis mosseae TaxID=27381 RepID=A0A9N9B116_FUNMO|nr:1184_t:CDS:2 [Funneliformis mosseae]